MLEVAGMEVKVVEEMKILGAFLAANGDVKYNGLTNHALEDDSTFRSLHTTLIHRIGFPQRFRKRVHRLVLIKSLFKNKCLITYLGIFMMYWIGNV